ncbi:MAG: GNAT family N-acetyltransferase [Clostridia bacterium]|nr:GNAT family N-acetyltransferase [Clostridia bacterium]
MQYHIRPIYPGDVPAIARLYMESYADSTWQEIWSYENAHQRIFDLTSSLINIGLICLVDDIVIGCIIAEVLSWHTGKQMEIKEVFVSPNYRDQGIGSSLIIEAERIGKERNVGEFFLWTNNDRKLTQFYRHCGYRSSNNVIQLVKQIKEE